jgi:hypothetical protein
VEEVTDVTPLPPRLCVCGREAKDPKRKLCWSCTMYKHRYGLTWPEVIDQRKTQGKLCRICDHLTRKDPIYFNGHRVCAGCFKILSVLNDPVRKGFFEMVLRQPV